MSKTFAQILGDIVVNVILAETQADAELATGTTCIEYTDENSAGIGWTYDEATETFIAPVIEEAPTEG
jgi:hypothetical protein